MNTRWLAAFAAFIGIVLIAYGVMAALVIPSTHALVVEATGPFAAMEDVAFAKGLLPFLYLLAIQGIGLGAVAVIAATGLLFMRPWALQTLIIGSVVLLGLAVVAIVMEPGSWDTQVSFIAFPILLWWHIHASRRANASAL